MVRNSVNYDFLSDMKFLQHDGLLIQANPFESKKIMTKFDYAN